MTTFKEKMIRNESVAKEYLMSAGVLMANRPCSICGSIRITPEPRSRIRCTDCGYSWELREGSIIGNTRITFLNFIRIARSFADDVPPAETAERLHIDITLISQIYHRIQLALVHGSVENQGMPIFLNNAGGTEYAAVRPCSHSPSDPVIFGIRARLETVSIEPFEPDMPDIITSMEIPRMIQSNILFIDAREKSFHGLIVYLPDRMNQETILVRPKNRVPWPPLAVFWRYAQTVWSRHRYMNRSQIPGFLQELAFRYNHRNMDMFCAILGEISRYDYAAATSDVNGGVTRSSSKQRAT